MTFSRAVAQSPWTRASVASIFTGVTPLVHGVAGRNDGLSDELVTLPEILRAQGYRCAGFITNGNVSAEFGFGQGFETFALLGENRYDHLHTLSDEVNREVVEWIDRESGGEAPFFLYVHTMDPHDPYAPPAPFRAVFAPDLEDPRDLAPPELESLAKIRGRLSGRFGPQVMALTPGSVLWMRGLLARAIPVSDRRIQDLRSLYEAEVAFNDRSFGELLGELQERGLDRTTVVVFLADHGEEFYEHGGWAHGRTLHREVLDIPLAIRLPGVRGGPIDRLAQQIDVLPTVLGYLGVPAPHGAQGEDLLAAGAGEPHPRRALAHLKMDGNAAVSIEEGEWKLIRSDKPRRKIELFHLPSDPGEQTDVASEEPIVVAYLLGALRSFERAGTARFEARPVQIDQDLRERLEALGYLN